MPSRVRHRHTLFADRQFPTFPLSGLGLPVMEIPLQPLKPASPSSARAAPDSLSVAAAKDSESADTAHVAVAVTSNNGAASKTFFVHPKLQAFIEETMTTVRGAL